MKKLFLLFILFVFSNANAVKDLQISDGQDFGNATRRVYLHCDMSVTLPDVWGEAPRRHFQIVLQESVVIKGTACPKGTIVGGTGVDYEEGEKRVCIQTLDIKNPFRRQHFATEALQTLFGIYRAKKRSDLVFDNFVLQVAMGNDPAINLYKKLGFKKDGEVVGLMNKMSIPRSAE